MLNHETTSAPGHAPIGISEGGGAPITFADLRGDPAELGGSIDRLRAVNAALLEELRKAAMTLENCSMLALITVAERDYLRRRAAGIFAVIAKIEKQTKPAGTLASPDTGDPVRHAGGF